jgi:hypothetical protein
MQVGQSRVESGQGLGDKKAGPGGWNGIVVSVVADNCQVMWHHFTCCTASMDRCPGSKKICPRGPALDDMDGTSLDTVLG